MRIIKSGFRYGDSAPKAIIELVERDIDAKGRIDKERAKLKEKLDEQGSTDKSTEAEADKINEAKNNTKSDIDSNKEKKNTKQFSS